MTHLLNIFARVEKRPAGGHGLQHDDAAFQAMIRNITHGKQKPAFAAQSLVKVASDALSGLHVTGEVKSGVLVPELYIRGERHDLEPSSDVELCAHAQVLVL